MKVSALNPIVRYAYSLPDSRPPVQTTLCALFWRCVGMTVIYLVPVALFGFYVWAWMTHPIDALALHVLVLFTTSVVFLGHLADKRKERLKAMRDTGDIPAKPPSFLKETAWAIKHRVCPLIEIER